MVVTHGELNKNLKVMKRPCDCKDQVDANALKEQGIAINEWSLGVEPAVVYLRHQYYGEVKIPMTVFYRFAEWYLRDQSSLLEKLEKEL